MKRYRYTSYDDYEEAQKSAYERKFKKVWARQENLETIVEWLEPREPASGLCHGVRNGTEVAWFRELLPGCLVIGTEIGGSVEPYIVEWDFNVENEKWQGEFDFVYSNSWDHTFEPKVTFPIWGRQLRPGGILILETNQRQEHTGDVSKAVNKTDPFGASPHELQQLIEGSCPLTFVDEVSLPYVDYNYRVALFFERRS